MSDDRLEPEAKAYLLDRATEHGSPHEARLSYCIVKLLRLYGAALARLPDSMQHCTIRFLECPVGHGRLTVTNWIDSGCLGCKRDAALDRAEAAERAGKHMAAAWRGADSARNTAESRLAEATALLKLAADWFDSPQHVVAWGAQLTCKKIRAFLLATPAQAAELECNCDLSGPIECEQHGPRE